jgi:hypothetical protein
MFNLRPNDFAQIYARFRSPIAELDCGEKCSPYNESGAPFCCDTRHAVPTAYQAEWEYLQANTDLWHTWQGESPEETQRLQTQTPAGQVLIACQGHTLCQRSFRSITCRSFPFFPYLTNEGEFIGLSYYWEYEDRCWVISNLDQVTPEYRQEFISVYDLLFEQMPQEKENFRYHSAMMRRIFGRKHRAIPLLHRNGAAYKISPKNSRMRRVDVERLPKFGPYQIAALLKFEDEE